MVYKTEGVCSKEIHLDVENGVIKSVSFVAGCDGNLKGLCSLVTGMKAADAIAKLKGIRCGQKPTSCPDQLARALQSLV